MLKTVYNLELETIFNPQQKHLCEIEEWLEKEDLETNTGFYDNWNSITYSFERNQFIVITENNLAIGFLTYSISDFRVVINIAEIKPDKRKKGIGNRLVDDCLRFFSEKGFFVAELYCVPIESEKIWKKLGFNNFPIGIKKDSKVWLYKVLIPIEPELKGDYFTETIELVSNTNIWTWKIKRKNATNQLEKPIICPSNNEWQLIWKNCHEVIDQSVVKRFNRNGVDYGDFVIITEL